MSRILSSSLIFLGWFFVSALLILASFLLVLTKTFDKKIIDYPSKQMGENITYTTYLTSPPLLNTFSANFEKNDARTLLIEKFLEENNSPMKGLGQFFVETADRFGLDWRLLPGIAKKESNLGKVLPKRSFNAFGWAIYAERNSGAVFSSWESAVEKVAKGLKTDYIDKGLTTPDLIMRKYTPQSKGSWTQDVNAAMDDIDR